ncbi:putative bifunctional diguanylate cyclase/phosphodiesterase [Longivirga aurantiaca]|uniref:Bifunctional diguanylate cyclase/phosphodiesterase n=1 Tax=Longivirga aurantiaca TaxID=1837743 RepID=A0ABW1SYX5_9ACTN
MRRRLSLTATFAAVSLVALAVLGAALVASMAQLLQRQALEHAVRTAQAYVSAGVGERVSLANWQTGQIDPPVVTSLRKNLHPDATMIRLQLWTHDATNLFDSDASTDDEPNHARLAAATVDGQLSTELVASGDFAGVVPSTSMGLEQVLSVYVPIYDTAMRVDPAAKYQPVGAAEVVLDYSPTLAATRDAVVTIGIITILGLGLVWALLFRTVHNASRRLRASSEENARLALLDPLTGLPNRRLLNERLETAVSDALRDGKHVGLLLLDIDRFKEINDSLGHDRGDQLLVQAADRLRAIVRETDTVARLGGDEFAILLKTVRSVADGVMFAERVLEVFDAPYEIDGLVLHVETSIGLALFPDHADDMQSLLKLADVAMYIAKAGRRGMSVYEADGDTNSPARLILLGDLRRALDSGDQLSVHYQAKLDLESKTVVGLEALLRWNHPLRGMVPPSEFIPLAEQTGLVHTVTDRVMRMVLTQQRAWIDEGLEIPVAVNLSALNLAEPELDRRIARLLEEYDVPARLLEFEITESAIMQDPERAAETLRRIAAMGSTIALDDFGIGNTSISQLRDLPIDTLKIDRSFISDMTNGNEVLVKVVTDLAHEFSMVAVAEGVELPETAERLRLLGCDIAQGFLYARPVPASELPDVLATYGMLTPAVLLD